jgi:hypothetical protein
MARDARDDKESGVSARDARLKVALRENLRRRKAQARGRSSPGAASEVKSEAADKDKR